MNQMSHSFVSQRGNQVQVFNERRVEQRADFWRGFGAAQATFAVVNGQRVECEAGCAFQASSRVHAAGF